MIKLFGRMIPAAARGLSGPRLHPTEVVTSRFRVLPHDIDMNRHLNNGRYLQVIDVNRMEYLLRTGVAQTILRERWKPILGSTTIRFRRELRLWERAVAATELLGWDDRWVYLEHRITTLAGRPVAVAMARAGFRSRGSWVPTGQLLAALPHQMSPMELPARVETWRRLDDCLAEGGMPRTSPAISSPTPPAQAFRASLKSQGCMGRSTGETARRAV
ncbi:hypothetical protein GCM10007973_22790 [Polymorphobacter multimanifer]|uniref:Acyl-CoA thioesterase FadM n=1 Tax=Polymorphobacter multimanifer TaxID=1070431 RepID=A0A841LGD9_9SPHN|nr:thioesterase family protein [Polymorphobacter multimanifer]MBB6228252.1 acyl-CoA thioesterase FadM [Polymorphobacter multimanifer]GGI85696.1 hypothetical protein GCM10007973_22790 [Polymorphobacter multimanifer]